MEPSQTPVRFSAARVLFALSLGCPLMVAALMGYDFRVRLVPLAHVILLISPLTGLFSYLVFPRPRFTWGTAFDVIWLVIFYAMMVLANVGIH